MANINFTLSSKVDKDSGLSELLIRFYAGKQISQRAKSNLLVNANYWDANRQNIVIPRFRIKDDEHQELIDKLHEQIVKIAELKQFINTAFMKVEAGNNDLPDDWLKNVVNNFYNYAAKPAPKIVKQPKSIVVEEKVIEKVEKPVKVKAEEPVAEQPTKPTEEIAPSPFFLVFDDFIAKNDISDNRKRHYRVVYRALQRFEAYYKIMLSFDNITGETLKNFERYLSEEHELKKRRKLDRVFKKFPESREIHERSGNYIKDMMGKLRTFCRYASGKMKEMPLNTPYFTSNPFDVYSIGTPTPLGTPYFLTIEERNHLYHYELNSERLSIQRDIFIFQCLVGCRVGDLMRLTWDNVIGDDLHYIPAKTCKNNPKTIVIPLHEIALAIIKKHKKPGRRALLPFVSKQQYNEDIKSMLTLAGITRKVVIVDPTTGQEVSKHINDIASSHMARRTFVGNLYNKVKDPDLIGSLSGHVEGSKAFARYRAIDMSVKKELVSKLD